MRPVAIVVDPPSFDDPTFHRQAPEQVFVQAFVAEAAVPALHEGIQDRFARRDVVALVAGVLRPAQDACAC